MRTLMKCRLLKNAGLTAKSHKNFISSGDPSTVPQLVGFLGCPLPLPYPWTLPQPVCLDSPVAGVIKMHTQILCHLAWVAAFIQHQPQNDISIKRWRKYHGLEFCTGTKGIEQTEG